ncbi:MAG TPA: hypothetical protein VMV94_08110 [Phycisphaerae bacterium]|nr:hypothetical protein [Phycisphaerae bacterium]
MFNRHQERHSARATWSTLAAVSIALIGAGCTGNSILSVMFPTDPAPASSNDLGIAIVKPSTAETASPGMQAIIQWADIGAVPGTVVRLAAQRQSAVHENRGDPIQLIGDGTPGSGRDAVADGDADIFIWDITGVRVGDYVITATIESPDGRTASAVSRDDKRGTTGVLTIVTALPVPVLTFTAPAADVTVNTGGTTTITWTDNGTANADARVLLGLDTDSDHENGNEIVLLRDAPLSDDDNSGTFTFVRLDENGDAVPDGTYTVFAIVDDNANDPVTSVAAGKIIVAP